MWKHFLLGPQPLTSFLFGRGGRRGGGEKKGEKLANSWHLKSWSVTATFSVRVDDLRLSFICISFTGPPCLDAGVPAPSAVLVGFLAARPDSWLSVIIASLPPKLLWDTPDSLWTYYCDTTVSSHWCERQSRFLALVYLETRFMKWRGYLFCWKGGCFRRTGFNDTTVSSAACTTHCEHGEKRCLRKWFSWCCHVYYFLLSLPESVITKIRVEHTNIWAGGGMKGVVTIFPFQVNMGAFDISTIDLGQDMTAIKNPRLNFWTKQSHTPSSDICLRVTNMTFISQPQS